MGLDPKQMIEIRNLIQSLGKSHTVILSSHILSEIQAVCDRVVVINQGKLIADDTPENLSKRLGGDRLRICVEGPEPEVHLALTQLEHVKTVTALPCRKDSCCEFELEAKDQCDIRRETAALLKSSPWLLLEITGSDLSLENIFLKLTDREGNRKGEGKK